MAYLKQSIASRLNAKLKAIESIRPLPTTVIRKLREQFSLELTYNSNAIEGNRLTLKETHLIINEGITVKGKSLKEHLEAKDHHEAINFLYELVERNRRNTINEHLVRSLQQMVVAKSDREIAGAYRRASVMITGSSHIPPDALDVPKFMGQLTRWITSHSQKLHPVELAAIAHHRLVNIHPFVDGNGRTARLLMNLLLMKQGYPIIVILQNDRKKYYDVLEKADKGENTPLVTFIAQAVERSLNIYLKALTPSGPRSERYQPLSKIAKHMPFSAKYLNLLVRQGKLEAHKEGRNWVSTLAAVKRYLENRERKRKLKK